VGKNPIGGEPVKSPIKKRKNICRSFVADGKFLFLSVLLIFLKQE
jgi:hypothetical protein